MSAESAVKMFRRGILSWHEVSLIFGPETETMIGTYREFVESHGGPRDRLKYISGYMKDGDPIGLPTILELRELASLI